MGLSRQVNSLNVSCRRWWLSWDVAVVFGGDGLGRVAHQNLRSRLKREP
jgi:hypothetical protein